MLLRNVLLHVLLLGVGICLGELESLLLQGLLRNQLLLLRNHLLLLLLLLLFGLLKRGLMCGSGTEIWLQQGLLQLDVGLVRRRDWQLKKRIVNSD